MRRRPLLYFLVAIALAYGGLCLLLFLNQDRLLFPAAALGRRQPLPPVRDVRSEWFEFAPGTRVRLAVAPHDSARDWLLFFCGNGEDLRAGVLWAAAWRAYGLQVAVPEYPGYGDSDGTPSEKAIVQMALAAARLVHARAAASGGRVLVAGASLGSFPAMRVAAEGLAERLLLVAPFTSVRDVAAVKFPWLPIGWLLRHPMDNVALAARVQVPTLVVHGDLDDVIPLRFGEGLAQALRARLVLAAGCGHNDLPLECGGPFGADLRAFLHGD